MFFAENKYLPERMKSSCKKLYQSVVQSATIIIHSIVTVKIFSAFKNISAVIVTINLHLIILLRDPLVSIRAVPCALRLLSFTMITSIIPISGAVIKNATILSLSLNPLLSYLLRLLLLLVKTTLSVCDILFTSLFRLFPCFTLVRILSGISL